MEVASVESDYLPIHASGAVVVAPTMVQRVWALVAGVVVVPIVVAHCPRMGARNVEVLGVGQQCEASDQVEVVLARRVLAHPRSVVTSSEREQDTMNG